MPTVGEPIVIGQFSLRDLCNCPDPCVPCCPICGCDPVGEMLWATVESTAGCGTIADSFPLTFDSVSQRWDSGSVVLGCGDPLRIRLYCSDSSPSATCADFRMLLDFPCAAITPIWSPSSCTCDPFELEFNIVGAVYLATCFCCVGGSLVSLRISITI